MYQSSRQLAQSLGGPIAPPVTSYGTAGDLFFKTGLPTFLNNAIKTITVIAGIVLLINIIVAGFQYMSAAGDPKKVESAWTRIWQSLLGLVIMISFVLIAGIINALIFQKTVDILNPTFFGPGTP